MNDGPRNDPEAEWASALGDFPEDLHGNTRGKRYQMKLDGRCPECLAEACERQQTGGLLSEPRRRVYERLSVTYLDVDGAPGGGDTTWTIGYVVHQIESGLLRWRRSC